VDLSFRHDFWLRRLPSSPRDAGRLERIVVRPAHGERRAPDEARVTVEGGLEGDRWAADPARRPGNQVSLINVHVARAVADGDEARAVLTGDNLHVDLDLSERNLPTGTLLTVGDAVLEVTAEPHRPCKHFHQRFGATNVKRVVRGNRTGLRTRGVLARVVVPGVLRVGATIHVRRPGAACLS
jgi:MOSC domain-containing protein YiiM